MTLQKIKTICEKQNTCRECILFKQGGRCPFRGIPKYWNIDRAKMLLKETIVSNLNK